MATPLRVWGGLLGAPALLSVSSEVSGVQIRVGAGEGQGSASRAPGRCIGLTDQKPGFRWVQIHSLSAGASRMGRWAALRKVMAGQRTSHRGPFGLQPHTGASPSQGGPGQVPPGALQPAFPLPAWLCPALFLGCVVQASPGDSRSRHCPGRPEASPGGLVPSPLHPVHTQCPGKRCRDLALPSCPRALGRGTRSVRDCPAERRPWGSSTQASPESALGGHLWFPWDRLPGPEAGPAHPWSGGPRPGWLGFHFYFWGDGKSREALSPPPPFPSPSVSQQDFWFARLGARKGMGSQATAGGSRALPVCVPVWAGAGREAVSQPPSAALRVGASVFPSVAWV